MKKNLILIVLLLTVFTVTSCKENILTDDNTKTKTQLQEGENSLVGTKWKLVGFFDIEKNELKELEPKDCEDCYTLAFGTDSTFSGFSTTRIINGEYSIDYITNNINILMHPLIALEELNLDAELYVEDLRNVFSFSLQENNSKLRIYFNTESYFLYNKLSQP